MPARRGREHQRRTPQRRARPDPGTAGTHLAPSRHLLPRPAAAIADPDRGNFVWLRDEDGGRYATRRVKGAGPMTEDSSRAEWLQHARSYLRNADPVLARLIDDRPGFDPRAWIAQLPPVADSFGALLFQVTGQQLSVAATRRTIARIEALFGGHLPSPAELLGADPGRLREAGLSWRKVSTLRDLAERLSDGRLSVDALTRPARRRADGRAHRDPGDRSLDRAGRADHRARPGGRRAAGRPRVPQGRPGGLSARPPPRPAGGPRHRRQMAPLPQPGDQLPVFGRLRSGPGTAWPSRGRRSAYPPGPAAGRSAAPASEAGANAIPRPFRTSSAARHRAPAALGPAARRRHGAPACCSSTRVTTVRSCPPRP